MSIAVRPFVESDRARWAAYILRHPRASLFHDLRWSDAVRAGYGYCGRHLVAERGGAICGVLPLTDVGSPLFGRSLVSVAFATGGGVLADDDAAAQALGHAALDLGRRLGVRHVELRDGDAPGADYLARSGVYAKFEKTLPAEADGVRAMLPRNRRAEVKKALRIDEPNENSFRTTNSAHEFWRVYAPAVRNLGTPVMPAKFIAALKANFGDDAEIGLVEHRGEPVAGLMSFWFRDRVMPYYIGADKMARDIRAYDYLYYKLMLRAVERGFKIFDFGRSKVGSTHFDTKGYWGFEPAPITHHFALVRGGKTPDLNPNNPKFGRAIALWRRLPLPVANFLGPIAARNFP